MTSTRKTVIVALGGNAINRKGEKGTMAEQFANVRRVAPALAKLWQRGYRVVVTHGNGPQVGNKLLQVQAALDKVPDTPLGVLVADTQGSMGYMISQCLENIFVRQLKVKAPHIVSVVTQVHVDPKDPSMLKPNKPVGPFYTEELAKKYAAEFGWTVVEDAGRGWRRVVPSPIPTRIHEVEGIKTLVDQGFLVIASGGGGIPVYTEHDGWLEGVDAVVDKDRASAVLADELKADEFFIATDVDQVAINFNKPNQVNLAKATVEELRRYQAEKHFAAGSMGPKVEAAVSFLANRDFPHRRCLITSPDKIEEALEGRSGTWITP
jgi:carbamate kinase